MVKDCWLSDDTITILSSGPFCSTLFSPQSLPFWHLVSLSPSSCEMFATATRNFVEEVDHGGLLIPVSSLNDTIALLSVVVKRKRFWFFQKPKYIPTDFNLNDLLTGDTPIKPGKLHNPLVYWVVWIYSFKITDVNVFLPTGVIETDFIKYNGTYGDNIQGTVDANFAHSNVSMKGKDSSKLQSSFGSLKKEEVDVQKLLRESKDRFVPLICFTVLSHRVK